MKLLIAVMICELLSLLVTPLFAAGAPGGTPQTTPPRPIDYATLVKLRREAAHRRRRIIFNNDGDDVLYTRKNPTPEALLALRTTPLLGSQVDSIFYSNSLCFGDALHNSHVMTPFTCTEQMFSNNGLPQLLAKGLDPIRIMADFCHQHGLEIFWDMRMNDTHDAMIGGYGPLLRPAFKLLHPEFLVGSEKKQPPNGPWSSVNYAEPAVRDKAYRFFEEVCRKFPVDGIEMDFFRHPCYFKDVAWGGQATQAERDMMTDLLRRVRSMTERVGMRRGRPILVAIRVPDSVGYCQAIGLDVEKWLQEGLVDLLVGSGYFRLNSWDYLVQLGHRYDVPVYPCLSDSRVRGEDRFHRSSLASYRARAMNAWAAGADGIYIFNYFNPRGALWRELGDPVSLATKDKLYFLSCRNGYPDRYLAGGDKYQHAPVLTPSNPWLMPQDRPVDLELPVGDDVTAATRAGFKPRVTCHVRTLGPGHVALTFNGQALSKPAAVGQWLDFEVPSQIMRKGLNHISLQASPAPEADDGQWPIRYEGGKLPQAPWQKEGFYTGCTEAIQDGKLLLADRSTASGSYAFYRCPCAIRPQDETVIEARLKPISGWSSVIMENGVHGEEITFEKGQVRARYCGLKCAAPNDGQFHTYRMVIKNQDFKVYIDGKLDLDGTGRFTHPAYNGRSGVMFGAANSPGEGEALWQFVRINTRTETLLDLALSIHYAQE